ncbi:MAG: DUF364 domain-containing protein [Acidobacteriota bacterium]|jgi:uncharacterized protein (DUF4213/DUF364 family)|nr:DUF364 domain-containing protein [Acidobacteriota bacterium]
MEPVSYQAGDILRETLREAGRILGGAIDSLEIERVVLGLFFTGVKLNDGSGGLCFTPLKSIPDAVCCPSSASAMPIAGKMRSMPVKPFLDGLLDGPPLKKTIAIAVLNALSQSCLRRCPPVGYEIRHGADALDEAVIGDDARVVVVGAIIPALRALKRRGKPFGILELDPSVLKEDELPWLVPPEQAADEVAQADMLVITGTTLINGTLEGLLRLRSPDAHVVVAGPTASGLPEAFFRRGVEVLGGVTVTEPDKVLDVVAEGGSGYHFFGKGAERTVMRRLS